MDPQDFRPLRPGEVKVGDRVRCLERDMNKTLTPGADYTVAVVLWDGYFIQVAGSGFICSIERFVRVPDDMPRLTPELLVALRRFHKAWAGAGPITGSGLALVEAIRAAPGILPAPPPALPAMWCGADAFGEDE